MHLYVTYYLNGEKQRDRISPLSYDQWRLIADGITYPADRAAYELWLNRNNLLEPSPSLLPRLLSIHKDYRFEAVSASDEPQQVLKFLRTFKGTWSALHETSFPLDGKVEVPPPSTENSALLQWSEQRKPTENCRYDNIVARCGSVGVAFRIEWKSWKKVDDSVLYVFEGNNGEEFLTCGSISHCKIYAEEWLSHRARAWSSLAPWEDVTEKELGSHIDTLPGGAAGILRSWGWSHVLDYVNRKAKEKNRIPSEKSPL